MVAVMFTTVIDCDRVIVRLVVRPVGPTIRFIHRLRTIRFTHRLLFAGATSSYYFLHFLRVKACWRWESVLVNKDGNCCFEIVEAIARNVFLIY